MASNYSSQHDIGIVNVGTAGTGTDLIGMMLAQENGVPLYKEFDDPYLAAQFFTSGASYSNTPPERRLIMGQADYRSGFGLYIADTNDPLRYYDSKGCDLRFKDRATLAYGETSIALPTITPVDISNGGFETWTGADPDGWTWNGLGQRAKETGTVHGGSNALKLFGDPGEGPGVEYRDLTWNAEYQGRTFTARCWVYSNYANKFNIQINDGVGQTTSTNNATTGSWVQISVTSKLSATASRLRVQCYFDADEDNTKYAYFDDVTVIDPTTGAPIKGLDFNSDHYIAFGNNLVKLDTVAGASLTYVYSFPATITDLVVFGVAGTDYLFIALGVSNAYWYMSTAEAFTESTAAAPNYQFFQVIYSTALTLWGNDTNSTLRSTTNPLNGGVAWSAQTQVDSDLYDITGLRDFNGLLGIAKEDKPFYIDSSGDVQKDLAPDCESYPATTSGLNSDVWLGKWYYPFGAQYLLEIGDTIVRRSPSEMCTNLSDYSGRVAAITHDGDQWLIMCLNNSTKVEVLMAREEVVDGVTTWVVHPYQELTMTGCNAAWVSSVYERRVWIASATSGQAIQYIPLPTGYGDLTSDANRAFATDGYFVTPFYHGNFKADQKAFYKVTATLGHTYDADIYFECHYKKLGDSSWTDAGDFKGTATNRQPSLYLPVDASSKKPYSTMMQFKLVGKTDDTDKTPILLNFTVDAILKPPAGTIIACTVAVSDGILSRLGNILSYRSTIKSTIDNARDHKWMINIRDIDGTSAYVNFLELPADVPRRVLVNNEKGRAKEYHYNLLLQIVDGVTY